MPKTLSDWNSYGFEVVLVAAVSIGFAICMAVIVLACHGSEGSLTLAASMMAAAGVAAGHIRSTMAAMRLDRKVDDNTEKTVAIDRKTEAVAVQVEEVKKIANGTSDRRAEEAKVAGVATGQATLIAAVAEIAPGLAPKIAAKAADLAVVATKEKVDAAFEAGVQKGREGSNPG